MGHQRCASPSAPVSRTTRSPTNDARASRACRTTPQAVFDRRDLARDAMPSASTRRSSASTSTTRRRQRPGSPSERLAPDRRVQRPCQPVRRGGAVPVLIASVIAARKSPASAGLFHGGHCAWRSLLAQRQQRRIAARRGRVDRHASSRSRSAAGNAGRRPWGRCRTGPGRRTAARRPPRRSGCG